MLTSQLTPLLAALSFAAQAHDGQYRKDGRTPYAAHPARVLLILRDLFGVTDPEVLTAAALHDTIEDTTTDWDELAEQFGERVAHFVALLTKDMRLPEPQREAAYRAALAAAPLPVQLCKLADVYDNVLDCEHLSPAAREKLVRKARGWLELFEPAFPAEYSHALEALRAVLSNR